MPVHSTTLPGGGSGYQWGKHGHKYASKADAERQARAIYANGYTGDDPDSGWNATGNAITSKPAHAAGVMLTDSDGRILFLKRAEGGNYAGHWALPGGCGEPGETPEETAVRETKEEIGHDIEYELVPIDHKDGSIPFTTFAAPVERKFDPKLNKEHTAFVWAHPDDAPQPLHPGVAATIASKKLTADNALALDKSARTVDQDGHLFVKHCVLTKAVVNPYKGEEIPGWQELGLDREKIYQLYRDPKELEKAYKTLDGKPLLIEHRPVTSDDHPPRIVGGAVSNPSYENGTIYGDLSVWPQDAIDDIDDERKRELSCGYRYTPVMKAGATESGECYDGRMADIKFNHVALVTEGRVDGAMVADSADVLGWSALSEALNALAWEEIALALDADKWITVKPNGPNAKGAPVKIGEGGEVKAGLGGKSIAARSRRVSKGN